MWGKAEEEAHLASPLNFIVVNFINFIITIINLIIIVIIVINFNLITILHKIRNMMLISTPQSIFNIGFTITIIIPPALPHHRDGGHQLCPHRPLHLQLPLPGQRGRRADIHHQAPPAPGGPGPAPTGHTLWHRLPRVWSHRQPPEAAVFSPGSW